MTAFTPPVQGNLNLQDAAGNQTAFNADGSQIMASPVANIVQKAKSVSTGSVASQSATFANGNKAGNSIVVLVGTGDNGALTVTDSNSNTYQKAILQANSTTFQAAIYYASGIVADATGKVNTVTVADASSDSMALQIYEVNGAITQPNSQPGQTTSGTGTSATPTLSALAAGIPNSLMFLAIAVGTAAQAVSVTSGTNWTLDSTQNTTTPAGLYTFGALSQFLKGLSPVVPTATVASSEPYAAVAAIFEPVAVGIKGTVKIGGSKGTNITTSTTTLVKTGACVLKAIVVNTAPASGGTLEIDDALTNTNSKGIITSPGVGRIDYNMEMAVGVSITTATHAGDYTVLVD